MRSQKILSTFWRTTFQSIPNTIWTTSYPSLWCVSLNLSKEKRKLLHYVRLISCHTLGNPWFIARLIMFAVSGSHTRTIQIATPTIGGLMKFAVKTVTCLGCKTALKASNSTSTSPLLTTRYVRWCKFSLQWEPYATTAVPDWWSYTINRCVLIGIDRAS
jgi:hypothetical protein